MPHVVIVVVGVVVMTFIVKSAVVVGVILMCVGANPESLRSIHLFTLKLSCF